MDCKVAIRKQITKVRRATVGNNHMMDTNFSSVFVSKVEQRLFVSWGE